MRKSKVAPWVVAGSLLLSAGLALAEEAPDPFFDDPVEVTGTVGVDLGDDTEDDVDVEDEDEVVVEDDEAVEDDTGDVEDDGTDEESEDEATEHPDNHGAVVSAAAHNHEHDEACGNHGAYVSHVARTGEEPPCATGEESVETSPQRKTRKSK